MSSEIETSKPGLKLSSAWIEIPGDISGLLFFFSIFGSSG